MAHETDVEAVARAMCFANGACGDLSCGIARRCCWPNASTDWHEEARAAITALDTARADRGLVTVPREPTEAMVESAMASTAARLSLPGSAMTQQREKMRIRYRAMIAASPTPGQDAGAGKA